MNSSYVTFGDFNKPKDPPPPPSHETFNMGSYDQENFTQSPSPQTVRYPIRQHMTQPRNPYNPQMLPPYPRHDVRHDIQGSPYMQNFQSPMMLPQPPPPPLRMPYPSHSAQTTPPSTLMEFDSPTNTTPIGSAFSEGFDESSSSSLKENTNPFSRPNRLMDATCVDINDHIVNCPICSKYYQNHTTVYVGIIILLGFIILIFLLKSIMEVKR